MSDPRMIIGALFLTGYYGVVFALAFFAIPQENGDLINNAMLQLGPPVGIIIGALFRTDKTDEKRADNTNAAFQAITATANASSSSPVPDHMLKPGETAQAEEPKP